MDALANFAYSTVATAPSPASSGTSLVVAAGQGARFPAAPFNVAIWPIGQIPTPANAEIARVTVKSTDTFTITRAQESSSARSVIIGDQIAAAITAKTLTDITGAISADVVLTSNLKIRQNTADGADTGRIILGAGGDCTEGGGSRGAEFALYGNENGSAGWVQIFPGNASGATFRVYSTTLGASIFSLLNADGTATFTSSAAALRSWIFNNTSTNGGSIWVERSGTDIGGMGPGISAGSNLDLEIFASAKLFLTAGGGQVLSTTIKADTTASAANVVVDATTGRLQRSTSSARYKANIADMADWRWLLSLRPVTFNAKENPKGRRFGGLLSEDVAEHGPRANGIPIYAGLDENGLPDDVAYGHLTAPLIKAIQGLTHMVEQLQARVDALTRKKDEPQ